MTIQPPASTSTAVKDDIESQRQATNVVAPDEGKSPRVEPSPATSEAAFDDGQYSDNSKVPRMGLLKLFWFFFYNFGLFAWGGPVAQIALIKQRLVVEDQWITLARFQRVFSVYQILPGPEAAELCMFFGCLSHGRIGGIVAGMAFILPGLILMLIASYVYALVGTSNLYVGASFRALQPVVSAMV